jgi:hypothetical protein
MTHSLGGKPRQHPIKCLRCEGDNFYKYYPHKGEMMRIVHNIEEVDIVDDVGRSMPRICATLDNRQENYKSHIIEVEGNIDNQPIAILIDCGPSHSYIDSKIVERFKLKICKHEKSRLVLLATRTNRKIICWFVYLNYTFNIIRPRFRSTRGPTKPLKPSTLLVNQ